MGRETLYCAVCQGVSQRADSSCTVEGSESKYLIPTEVLENKYSQQMKRDN